MSTIFPGMDPYLEAGALWPGLHAALIVYIRDQLQPLLRPRYLASIEERVYLESPRPRHRSGRPRSSSPAGRPAPAVAVLEADAPVVVHAPPRDVHETYVAVLDRQSGERVVTVIEVVSPTNKYAGPGRTSYLAKQDEILRGPVHLVEIDLLRTGRTSWPCRNSRHGAGGIRLSRLRESGRRAARHLRAIPAPGCATDCPACASRWPATTRT